MTRESRKPASGSARGAGALLLILGCFAASGAARLGDVAVFVPSALEFLSSTAWAQSAETRVDKAEPKDGGAAGAESLAHDPTLAGAKSVAAAAMAALGMDGDGAAAAKPAAKAGGAAEGRATAAEFIDPATIATATTKTASIADRLARLKPAEVDGESADLLETLRERERELGAVAEELERRRLAIDAASRRLEERLRDLDRAKEQLSTLVASIDQAAARDVQHLITMYEKMKPKEAGALFNTMEPSFASGFLSRMKPDKAAAIMAKMTPEKAYAVSAHLAGRNVRTETPPF